MCVYLFGSTAVDDAASVAAVVLVDVQSICFGLAVEAANFTSISFISLLYLTIQMWSFLFSFFFLCATKLLQEKSRAGHCTHCSSSYFTLPIVLRLLLLLSPHFLLHFYFSSRWNFNGAFVMQYSLVLMIICESLLCKLQPVHPKPLWVTKALTEAPAGRALFSFPFPCHRLLVDCCCSLCFVCLHFNVAGASEGSCYAGSLSVCHFLALL